MDASDLGRRIVDRAQRGARGDAIPTPDLGSFRAVGRRTRVMRLGLAAVLVGGTLLTLALVPSADDRRFLPASNVGIVVLDVSTSVKPSTYDLIREQLGGCRPRLAGSASSSSRTSPTRPSRRRHRPASYASSSASSARATATTRTAILSRARRGSSGSRPARRSPPACCSPPSCSRSVRTPTAGSS